MKIVFLPGCFPWCPEGPERMKLLKHCRLQLETLQWRHVDLIVNDPFNNRSVAVKALTPYEPDGWLFYIKEVNFDADTLIIEWGGSIEWDEYYTAFKHNQMSWTDDIVQLLQAVD
ncbi:MAG: hypothetical protein U0V74_09620 [Chitinophagales bacterium]